VRPKPNFCSHTHSWATHLDHSVVHLSSASVWIWMVGGPY
jgi:hypothetical protein